jgi:sugar phosphate isomerase/epimerase
MPQPKLYLAIDNCFASKRWTRPAEWGRIVADLGIRYVEASADNEIDPLYTTASALAEWTDEVRRLNDTHGVRVANLYSGHGTYATLGLAHHDASVRRHIREDWLGPMIDQAARLDAGLGFFCHAFGQDILDDPAAYGEARDRLYDDLAAVARYAGRSGRSVGLEQMYSPHQVPWRLDGTAEMLREIHARAGAAMYLTLDTGHAVGQQRFARPREEELQSATDRPSLHGGLRLAAALERLWVGSTRAHELLCRAGRTQGWQRSALLDQLREEIDRSGHLFAEPIDGDVYEWARRFGRLSPIVHLQQTDGHKSSHWPFTPERNEMGIIDAGRYLQALADSFAAEPTAGEPPAVSEIYLTLEVFGSTGCHPPALIEQLRESVAYWRRFVPADGVRLDELDCVDTTVAVG